MQNPQHGGPHNNYLPLHPAVVTTNRVVYKDKVINQYTFGTKIGKGKNGTVYAAYLLSDDETTVETVAIKAIRRETNEGRSKRKYRGLRRNIPRQTNHTSVGDAIHSEEHRIRKEIAIMKKLHHPHVVQLREVLDDRLIQTIYLVMEYCDGGEVEWTDGHDNPISSLEQTRRIMRDAIQGLDYLHSQGIIHRDIKPANLLWTKDRAHVKIADFGTAHFSYAQRLSSLGNNTPSAEDPDDPFFLDDSGLAIKAGTPIFMAPEVVYDSIIRDDEEDPPPPQPITKAIDVWALGITFYCLLFGCLPYKLDHNLPSLSQEFAVYRSINKEEWSIKDTMGTDQISTQSADEDSEAGIIIHLLYHFLTKNVTERITLAEVKSNPWFLNDLPNPVTWLQDLGVAQIIVSPQETSVAITSTEVKLGPWKRMARGISSVLGIGPILTRGRERQRDDQSSSSQGQQLGRHRTVTDMVRRPKEHLKGKGKEVERSLSRLRSSATLGRQLSVKSSRNDPATRSSNNSSMTWRFSKRSSQSSTPKPASPQEPNMSTFIPTRATSNSRLVGPRASAEVLGYPQSSNHGGGLTSDRRVSSFGDHPAELRNTVFEDNDDVVGDGHLQFGAPSSDSDENDAEGDSEEGTSQPRMVAHHLRQRLYDIPPSRHKSVDVIPYERERELDDSSSDDDDDGEGILIDFPRRR